MAKHCFSDEKKFNLDGPDGWHSYWHDLRKDQRIMSKRQNGGGTVMVWGAIGYLKKSDLVFVEGNADSLQYQDIVGRQFPAFGPIMAGPNWKFQQDNASIHVSRSTLAWMAAKKMPLFGVWPACSPDLSIIENLWGDLARAVYKEGRQFSTQAELREAIVEAWESIGQDRVKHLYDTIHRRIRACYDKKGKWTKY